MAYFSNHHQYDRFILHKASSSKPRDACPRVGFSSQKNSQDNSFAHNKHLTTDQIIQQISRDYFPEPRDCPQAKKSFLFDATKGEKKYFFKISHHQQRQSDGKREPLVPFRSIPLMEPRAKHRGKQESADFGQTVARQPTKQSGSGWSSQLMPRFMSRREATPETYIRKLTSSLARKQLEKRDNFKRIKLEI